MIAPVWLSPAEAAEYLRLPSVKSLYALVERRELTAHRLGRRLRFRVADLDAAMRPPDEDGPARCPARAAP